MIIWKIIKWEAASMLLALDIIWIPLCYTKLLRLGLFLVIILLLISVLQLIWNTVYKRQLITSGSMRKTKTYSQILFSAMLLIHIHLTLILILLIKSLKILPDFNHFQMISFKIINSYLQKYSYLPTSSSLTNQT